MWRPNTEVSRIRYNIVFKGGGLGDQICRIPALLAILKDHHHVDLDVWVPDYFMELATHWVRDPRADIKPFSRFKAELKPDIPARVTDEMFHTTLRTHLVDHAFHLLLDRDPGPHEQDYPRLRLEETDISEFNLPKDYVVLTTGFTAKVREMIPEAANGVTDHILSRGLTPVYLGKHTASLGLENPLIKIDGTFTADYTKGVDLIDKTTLLQAGKIMGQAKAVIGLDNGLLHLAGCTDVPIIAGYSTVKPEHRLPYRDGRLGKDCYVVVPPQALGCRFCQSNWGFLGAHDFRHCKYGDNACTANMPAKLYNNYLDQILG